MYKWTCWMSGERSTEIIHFVPDVTSEGLRWGNLGSNELLFKLETCVLYFYVRILLPNMVSASKPCTCVGLSFFSRTFGLNVQRKLPDVRPIKIPNIYFTVWKTV